MLHFCQQHVKENIDSTCTHNIVFALVVVQHPFISQAKPVTILRDLITEAMEMKAKRQQEQQRELEEEDDNSVCILSSSKSNHQAAIHAKAIWLYGYLVSSRRRRRRWTLTLW